MGANRTNPRLASKWQTMKQEDLIKTALKDLALDRPYYQARVIGDRIEFHLYGGEVAVWTGPGVTTWQDVADITDGVTTKAGEESRIPSGDLNRFLVTDLRHLAQEHNISITAGSRPKTKRHLIAELNTLRQEEEQS